MADNDFNARPMGEADIHSPPGGTEFKPAVPLKDTGVEFAPEGSDADETVGVRQQLTDSAGKLQTQAGDKVREFADMGKDRASGALDQLAQMLTDAASQVDGKLSAQYGGYARNAAEAVQGFSQQIRDQDMDTLMENARGLIRKSPSVAIGAAAAIGFVLARVVQAGVDSDSRANKG